MNPVLKCSSVFLLNCIHSYNCLLLILHFYYSLLMLHLFHFCIILLLFQDLCMNMMHLLQFHKLLVMLVWNLVSKLELLGWLLQRMFLSCLNNSHFLDWSQCNYNSQLAVLLVCCFLNWYLIHSCTLLLSMYLLRILLSKSAGGSG